MIARGFPESNSIILIFFYLDEAMTPSLHFDEFKMKRHVKLWSDPQENDLFLAECTYPFLHLIWRNWPLLTGLNHALYGNISLIWTIGSWELMKNTLDMFNFYLQPLGNWTISNFFWKRCLRRWRDISGCWVAIFEWVTATCFMEQSIMLFM